MAAALAFGWTALLRAEYARLGEHATAGAAFVSNLLLWSESGYFDHAAATKPFLHLWSLGVEEQFYLLWPVVLCLAWRLRFNLLFVIAGLGLLSFAANVVATSANPVDAFYSPLTRFWELMVGAMLASGEMQRRSRTLDVAGPGAQLAGPPRLASLASLVGAELIAPSVEQPVKTARRRGGVTCCCRPHPTRTAGSRWPRTSSCPALTANCSTRCRSAIRPTYRCSTPSLSCARKGYAFRPGTGTSCTA